MSENEDTVYYTISKRVMCWLQLLLVAPWLRGQEKRRKRRKKGIGTGVVHKGEANLLPLHHLQPVAAVEPGAVGYK